MPFLAAIVFILPILFGSSREKQVKPLTGQEIVQVLNLEETPLRPEI